MTVKKSLKVAGAVVGGFVLFGMGVGAGGAGKGAEPASAVTVPTAAATVTVTAKPVVETKTVTVEKTPQSCLDALDTASQGISLLAGVPRLAGQAITATADGDADALNKITGQVTDINDQIKALTPGLKVSADSCRAGAK